MWRARDRLMRTTVAVKLLRSADPDRQRRFTQEAELLANIHHPNVVATIDVSALALSRRVKFASS